MSSRKAPSDVLELAAQIKALGPSDRLRLAADLLAKGRDDVAFLVAEPVIASLGLAYAKKNLSRPG